MTPRAAAEQLWPDAAWIIGHGRYAVIAYCRVTTVTLHEEQDRATRALEQIERTGCGGGCHRAHALLDLTPRRPRRLDLSDPYMGQVRTEVAIDDRIDEAVGDTAPRCEFGTVFVLSDWLTARKHVASYLLDHPDATDADLCTQAAVAWLSTRKAVTS